MEGVRYSRVLYSHKEFRDGVSFESNDMRGGL